jgi:hypothetical protein
MLKLYRSGLIALPAPRNKPPEIKNIRRTPEAEPIPLIRLEAGRVDLSFQAVESKTSSFWNELIDRCHYLGYTRSGGAQMRFFVYAAGQLCALLGFSAAAWKSAPRDEFIGWSQEARQKNLHRIVDNSRFLILPWIESSFAQTRK